MGDGRMRFDGKGQRKMSQMAFGKMDIEETTK